MHFALVDWIVLAVYFLFCIALGLWLKDRAGKNLSSYFLASRSFPWWLAGTSMVATTFSVDTPLAVTGFVANRGIAGNWFWWTQAFSTITVTFFFARLWRRAHVLTDVEFLELRYAAQPAAFLKGFSVIYRGVLLALIKIGFVIVAMRKIMEAIFPEHSEAVLLASIGAVLLYCVLSGFWGVVATDCFQFAIAMIGSILFAFYAIDHVGGLASLHTQLVTQFGDKGTSDLLAVFPPADSVWMPLFTMVVYLGIMWWADARVEGGNYIAQRIMSTRDERQATLATLWFNVAHYVIRPWPWIVVALVSLVVFPDLIDKESGYPKLMSEVLPPGIFGLVVTSFFAAFMSTVDTLTNWASSYLINDGYKRFLVKERSDQHYVTASKIATAALLLGSLAMSYWMTSITDAWELIVSLTAGLGIVYAARWFWWRVNAFSEISAMIASGLSTAYTMYFTTWDFPHRFCFILVVSTVTWMVVTFLTPAVSLKQLAAFYTRVRPFSFFWKPVVATLDPSLAHSPDNFWKSLRLWVWGIVMVYGSLIALGQWIFTPGLDALLTTGIALGAGILLWWELSGHSPKTASDEAASPSLASRAVSDSEAATTS